MADLTGVTIEGFKNGKKVTFSPAELSGDIVLNNVPCDISVFVGAAVRMQASGTAVNALADSLTNANVIGIVQSKPTSTTCNIRVTGVSLSVFAGLDVTKEYYLSDTVAGQITTTIPISSGHVVLRIGQPFSSSELLMNKGQAVVRV